MEKLISEQIVDSILSQDKETFVDAFNSAIAAKVSDALEVKKVEIASSLITPEMAVEEEVEQVEEAFRLFHPGKKAIIKNIDKHGFTGRENHPPTDGSLNGHTIRITDYGDATGKHGVTSGLGAPRYQAVRGKVLTGTHKGKEFEFIQHELKHAEDVKEEVEQVEEGAKEWKKAFKKVASKNLNKDVAAVRSSAYRLDKATKSDDEDDEEVKDKVRKGMSEEAEQIDEISTDLIKKSRMIANKKAADADNRGHDVEREIHASQAGRFQKALDKRDRKAQLSRVSGAKARKYILSKEEAEQIDEDKNALTADHKKAITAHMVKRYGGSKEDVSFRYDPVTRTHSVEHESNETGMGYSHMINFKGRTATVEKHPYMTSDYYS